MNKKYFSLLVITMLLLFSGCTLMTLGKSRFWQKGDIVLEGAVTPKQEYYMLSIGTSSKPAEELPDVYINWPNGEKVILSSVTVDMLENSQFTRSDVSGSRPEKTTSYYWQGYCFIVYDEKIIGFEAGAHFITKDNDNFDGFWDKTQTKYYDFPIAKKDLEKLFGKADEICIGHYTGSW